MYGFKGIGRMFGRLWRKILSSFDKAADTESRAKTSSTPNMNRWTW